MIADQIQTGKARVLQEERAWDEVVSKVVGPEAQLVSVSRFTGDSRVYTAGDVVTKIRSRRARQPKGLNSLADEASILTSIGLDVQYSELGDWEILVFPRLAGTSLESEIPSSGVFKRARAILRIVPALNNLHRKGISHGDLIPDNVLVDEKGGVKLIDFDRARKGGGTAVRMRDWLGISPIGLSPNPFWNFAIAVLVPKSQTLARRLRTRMMGKMPVTDCNPVDRDLVALRDAWTLAQSAEANAPGQSLAYYALTYKDCHFVGERPWYLRWEAIKRAVDFQDKSVLELGCNMGLLSTFAMFHGARSAHGVDADSVIVSAATKVGDALDSGATFETIDLMGPDDWEPALGGRDLVIAMSLVHWLPDKDRVLNFLGKHEELIYEGHDPLEVESQRLRSIGFRDISVIT